MGKSLKNKSFQELTFYVSAVLMLIILVFVVSWLLGFLAQRLNMVLNPNVLQPSVATQFNIDGFKKLNLTNN